MSLHESLRRHLKSEEALRGTPMFKLTENYIQKLPRLKVEDDITLSDIYSSLLEDFLWDADLSRGQRAGIARLFGEIMFIHGSEDSYKVTAGDIRKISNEQLMLLGGGPSGFHPGPRSVEILRRLFGKEEEKG